MTGPEQNLVRSGACRLEQGSGEPAAMDRIDASEIDGVETVPRLHRLEKTVTEDLGPTRMEIRVVVAHKKDLGL